MQLEGSPNTNLIQPNTDQEIICSYNFYNCDDFNSCSEVMKVFNECGNEDIHYLDGDKEGVPCESLCG